MVILLAMTSIYVVDFISQGNNFVSNQLIASISAIFNKSLILFLFVSLLHSSFSEIRETEFSKLDFRG